MSLESYIDSIILQVALHFVIRVLQIMTMSKKIGMCSLC